MKRILSFIIAAMMLMAVCPMAFADDIEILNVDIINAEVAPLWGMAWYDGLDYEVEDFDGFDETEHYWLEEETYDTFFDYAKPDCHYSKCWEFEADAGYVFADHVAITINGSTSALDSIYSGVDDDGDTLYVWTKAAKPVEDMDSLVSFAAVDDVELYPVAGEKAGDHLGFNVLESQRYDFDSAAWYCDTDNRTMEPDDVFETGKEYSMWIDLTVRTGYEWDEFALVLINGSEDNCDYTEYDDEYPEYFTIWTVPHEATDTSTVPEAFLLYDESVTYAPALYRINMNTGKPFELVQSFGGDVLFSMEKIDGKYYGYTANYDYAVIDAVTFDTIYYAYNDDIGSPAVNDMTLNKDEGVLYGINAAEQTIFTIAAGSGETTVIKKLGFAPITLAYAEGAFYCTEYDNNGIWKIDAETFEEERISEFDISDVAYPMYVQTMDYNPADGNLYTLGYDYLSDGFVGVIDLDGIVQRVTFIGTIEYGGLCFADDDLHLAEVALTGIALDKTELTLEIPGRETAELKVIYTPAGAINKNVTWESSDKAVATVDDGVVTAVAPGEAIIYATSEDGGFTAECKVTVVEVDYLLFEDFENFNEENWTFIDADGDGENWYLGEQSIYASDHVYQGSRCIVSASYVNGMGALTPDNWMISDAFKSTADAELTWYAAGQDPTYYAENYSVYVLPADYTDLSQAVRVYTGKTTNAYTEHRVSLGSFAGEKIRIAFRHHDVTDMFRLNIDFITVKGDENSEIIPVTGVELDKTEVTIADKGENTVQLTARITPDDATIDFVTWESSDETVATVDENGLVKGVKAGEATITVTTKDGGFTATCKVTVTAATFVLYEDFETDSVADWMVVDADGDGFAWGLGSSETMYVYEGEYCASSASWDPDTGALTPDNWLISPVFTPDETSVLSWYAAGQDPQYAAENYGVYVLPADAQDVSEGTEIFYGTATEAFERKSVSLEDYAGQEIMIAFRHYDVTDMFMLNLDLITVSAKGETPIEPPVPAEYTVTFVDGLTEDVIATVTVEEGKDAEFPEAPEHEGYTFTGWDNDGKNITADTTITALYEEIVIPIETIIGDCDGNGEVNTRDAVVVLKYAAGMMGELTDEQIVVFDTNKDGTVNTFDAVMILKFAAGMITEF